MHVQYSCCGIYIYILYYVAAQVYDCHVCKMKLIDFGPQLLMAIAGIVDSCCSCCSIISWVLLTD